MVNKEEGGRGEEGGRERLESPAEVEGGEGEGEQESDNWQRVAAAFTARQAAQLELKALLRHNEDVAR